MKILHINIQDEEIEMIDDIKKYIKRNTWKSVDDNEAVLLVIKLFTQTYIEDIWKNSLPPS